MKPFAFVFPGQGSQAVGMLDAWGSHPAVAQTLQEASDALGEDVAVLIKQGPKEALALTTNTQPVMLVAGVAAYRAWRAEGGTEPAVLAGHSLGASAVSYIGQLDPRVSAIVAFDDQIVEHVPSSAKLGCSGQIPVSITPTTVPAPRTGSRR